MLSANTGVLRQQAAIPAITKVFFMLFFQGLKIHHFMFYGYSSLISAAGILWQNDHILLDVNQISISQRH